MVAPAGDVRVEMVPLAALTAWPGNPKRHDLDGLRESLRRFGFVAPIVEDARTGRLVAGHGRSEALRAMLAAGEAPPARVGVDAATGDWLVPVLRGASFADEREAEAYLVADNRLVEVGGWDTAMLAEILEDAAARGAAGLVGTGFTADEVASISAGAPPPPEPGPPTCPKCGHAQGTLGADAAGVAS